MMEWVWKWRLITRYSGVTLNLFSLSLSLSLSLSCLLFKSESVTVQYTRQVISKGIEVINDSISVELAPWLLYHYGVYSQVSRVEGCSVRGTKRQRTCHMWRIINVMEYMTTCKNWKTPMMFKCQSIYVSACVCVCVCALIRVCMTSVTHTHIHTRGRTYSSRWPT